MVPFSGWNMPVQYTGIIEEHLHTRSKAGLFDICHMGELFIRGSSAEQDLDRLMTCDIKGLVDGRCRYGFLLNREGGIIDDVIVFRISAREYMMVVNAGTVESDGKWIRSNLSSGTDLSDGSADIAKLDLQGPLSTEVTGSVFGSSAVRAIKRFFFINAGFKGVDVMISRTGYTGETGYEMFFSASAAGELWDVLMSFGSVRPAGLGARDSLRMEMGYSLYGHDIDVEHTPAEAGLGKFVRMEKDFIGKKKLLEQAEHGFGRVLAGFVCEGRRAARENYLAKVDNIEAGRVTSGTFSPCLKKGIGLCYIDREFAVEGREITLTRGGVEIRANIRKPPFVRK